MEKKIYFEFLFLVLLGMATSFSLPPFNYFVINFITFTLFFVFLIKKSNVQVDKKFFLSMAGYLVLAILQLVFTGYQFH